MQLLPVYYRKPTYDVYEKLSLRIILPHQNFEEHKTIKLLQSDDFEFKGFFLNLMSIVGIRIPLPFMEIESSIWCYCFELTNECISIKRIVTFSIGYPEYQVAKGKWKTHKDFYETTSSNN